MRFTLVWGATDILIAILLIKALAVLNLHCKSSSFQSERYSSFWMSNSFNSLHKICILLREQAETQHYLSPKSHKTCSVLSLILSNVSPPKNHACQPLWSAIAQPCPRISPSWRRSLEAKHSQGIKYVTLQSSDLKSQLTSVMEAYSTEQEISPRNTQVPQKAAAALNNSVRHIHDLPSFHRDPLGVDSLRMSLSCVPDLEKLWLLDHHHIWMHMDTISSP